MATETKAMRQKRERPLKDRHEFLDPTPIAVPVHLKRPPTLQDQIRQMVKSEEWRRKMECLGAETFEEADDFECGDDYDPKSPYEACFDQEQALLPPKNPTHAEEDNPKRPKGGSRQNPDQVEGKKAGKKSPQKTEPADPDVSDDD